MMTTRTTFLFSAALAASSSLIPGAAMAGTTPAPAAEDIPYCSQLPPCSAVTDCLLGSPEPAPEARETEDDEDDAAV